MAKTEAPTTHGWYLDPSSPEQLRFWTGTAWSSLTKFGTADEMAYARTCGDPSSGAALPPMRPRPAVEADAPLRPKPTPNATHHSADPPPNLALALIEQNLFTSITIAVTLVYLGIAVSIGYVIVGVVPVVLSVVAFRNHEKAAFLAALAAAMAVVIAIGVHR